MSVRSKVFNYNVELLSWDCLSTSFINYWSFDISCTDIDLEGQTNFNYSVRGESPTWRKDLEDFYTELTGFEGLLGILYSGLCAYYLAIDFVLVVLES